MNITGTSGESANFTKVKQEQKNLQEETVFFSEILTKATANQETAQAKQKANSLNKSPNNNDDDNDRQDLNARDDANETSVESAVKKETKKTHFSEDETETKDKKDEPKQAQKNNIAVHLPLEILKLNKLNDLINIIGNKISEIAIEQKVDFEPKKYLFKIDSKEQLPLELMIKKIDGKFSIILYSDGELKEDLIRNLSQLTDFLKARGIEVASLNIAQLKKGEQSQSGEQGRQSPFYWAGTEDESDEEVEEFKIS